MFSWIPTPIAAIMGTALILFIGYAGIKGTNFKGDKKDSSSSDKENKG